MLGRWQDRIPGDAEDLQAILAEDVVFHSPYLEEPYSDAGAALILTTVSEVFQDFTYHREIIEGHHWALEFSARVGDQSLKGIDLIRLTTMVWIGGLRGLCSAIQWPAGARRGDGPAAEQHVLDASRCSTIATT